MNRTAVDHSVLEQNLDYLQDELKVLLGPYISGEAGDSLEVVKAKKMVPRLLNSQPIAGPSTPIVCLIRKRKPVVGPIPSNTGTHGSVLSTVQASATRSWNM